MVDLEVNDPVHVNRENRQLEGVVAFMGKVQFADGDDWSQTVVINVKNLLSISNLPGVGMDTAGFIGVMTGIAGGLAVFSVGATISGVANALTIFSSIVPSAIKSMYVSLSSCPILCARSSDCMRTSKL